MISTLIIKSRFDYQDSNKPYSYHGACQGGHRLKILQRGILLFAIDWRGMYVSVLLVQKLGPPRPLSNSYSPDIRVTSVAAVSRRWCNAETGLWSTMREVQRGDWNRNPILPACRQCTRLLRGGSDSDHAVTKLWEHLHCHSWPKQMAVCPVMSLVLLWLLRTGKGSPILWRLLLLLLHTGLGTQVYWRLLRLCTGTGPPVLR